MPPAPAEAATGASTVPAVAAEYRRQVVAVGETTAKTLERLWRETLTDPGPFPDLTAAWAARVPEAVAAVTAAQVVAADMAEAYTAAVLAAQGSSSSAVAEVVPGAFAGISVEGVPLPDLLSIPARRTAYALRAGVAPQVATTRGTADLVKYARTETADAARASSQVAGTAHRVGGYVRHLQLPSCAKCAILAGRWYRWSAGFDRHPNCDCYHVAVEHVEVGRSLTTDPRLAILTGHVHGLSERELEAIRLGADPSQVVNAQDGMYVAGGHRYTTTGTTRRGIAGARLIAAAINRAEGGPPGRTYRNLTMDRLTLAEATRRFEGLLRKGTTFTRRYADGRVQTTAYRFSTSPRASVADLLGSATSREDAIRLLTNHGYLI